MNNSIARSILDIDADVVITKEFIKKQYRIKALQCHPDKNSSPDANAQFQQVHEAYEILSEASVPIERQSYVDMLKEFLGNASPVVQLILSKLSQDTAVRFVGSIDKLILIDIYKLLATHRDILYIPDSFMNEIKNILIAKTNGDERIILNPSLEDLWCDNLYKLCIDERIYLIPLWHNELVYDNSGCDLYVTCIPILPKNVEIDERNNMIVQLNYDVSQLMDHDNIIVDVGGREFSFRPSKLKIVRKQKLVFYNSGISAIKHKNIYDVSTRGDVILEITLNSRGNQGSPLPPPFR